MKLKKFFEKIRKIFLRLRGKDPDLLAEIRKLGQERERSREAIRKLQEEIITVKNKNSELQVGADEIAHLKLTIEQLERRNEELNSQNQKLIAQIRDGQKDIESLRQFYLDCLKATDWKEKNARILRLIEACDKVFFLSDEEIKEVEKSRTLTSEQKKKRFWKKNDNS